MKFLPLSPQTSVRFTKIRDCDSEIVGMTGRRTTLPEPGPRLVMFCPGRGVHLAVRVVGSGALAIREPP